MTESTGNESGNALFARIQQLVTERGVDIRQQLQGHALQLQFADGQRILINFDAQTRNVWLAARAGGTEFMPRADNWYANDQTEFFSRLRELMEQVIASNPINARAASAQPAQPVRPATIIYAEVKASHGLRNVLIVLLAAMLGFWAAQRLNRPPHLLPVPAANEQAQMAALNQPDAGTQCSGGFPPNGSINVFSENGLRTDGTNDPEIVLKNDHAHPLLLILSAPHTAIPALSIMIHARQSTTLHLPAGQYDMMFSAGDTWCNPHRGFTGGHVLKFDKPLLVQMERPMQLVMQTSGSNFEDFQLFVKTPTPEVATPPPTFSGDGSMEVQRQANGHFYLPGTIENVPVTFMVDTGASVTSISADLARQAGIRNCKEMQFQTANGTATGCIALAPHMTLGNFVLQNITVAVMPHMETNLLGANVLRNFQVSQSDSTMLIGRK